MSQQVNPFTPEQAAHIAYLIRIDCPHWNHGVIMAELKIAAMAGATITQAMGAAAKAANNPRAKAPTSINWPEHWEDPKAKAAMDRTTPRLCVECDPPRKHAVSDLTKHAHGWVCNNHQETA